MGGFCLDMTHDPERVWPRGLDRLVLEPRAITFLPAEFPTISVPYVPEQNILDKSKADHVAKSLVCLQALWYCTSFFSRLAMALPITLLELNTFAHSICALLIYILWWEKPLDIGKPTLIKTDASETHRDFCAVCFSLDRRLWIKNWRFADKSTGKPNKWIAPYHTWDELSAMTHSNNQVPDQEQNILLGQILGVHNREIPTQRFVGRRPSISPFKGLDTNACPWLFVSYSPPIIQLKARESITDTNRYVRSTFHTLEMDETFLARIQRCSRVFGIRPYVQDADGGTFHCLATREINYMSSTLVREWFDNSFGFDEIQTPLITLSGIFYGGLHALSWDSAALKTGLETLLWKISCATSMSSGFLIFVTMVLRTAWRQVEVPLGSTGVKGLWENFRQSGVNDLVYLAVSLLCLAVLLLYMLSRVFLIREVFVSLPHADPAVYRTPNWSLYWPHVS